MKVTEKNSFYDPDRIYGPMDVPDAIVDLDVDPDTHELMATMSSGETIELGRWIGPDPVSLEALTVDINSRLRSIRADGEHFLTEQVRFDGHEGSAIVGHGLHDKYEFTTGYNEIVNDYYDESRNLIFAVSDKQKIASDIGYKVTFATGVVVWAVNSTAIVRGIYVRDGSGPVCYSRANGTNLIIYEFPQPVWVKGFRFKSGDPDKYATHYTIQHMDISTNKLVDSFSDTNDNGDMSVREYFFDEPILTRDVRWKSDGGRASLPDKISSCGLFEVILVEQGHNELYKPLVADPSSAKIVETPETFEVSSLNGNPAVIDNPLSVSNYARIYSKAQIRRTMITAGSVQPVPFTDIDKDFIGLRLEYPGIVLPAGKYQMKVSSLTNASKGSTWFVTDNAEHSPISEVRYELDGFRDTLSNVYLTFTLPSQKTIAVCQSAKVNTFTSNIAQQAHAEIWKVG